MKIKLTSLFLLLAAPLLLAQATPTLMSYQGRVTDAGGVLIGNTAPVNRTVSFRLYSASSGGTTLYAETQAVTISGGEFSVLIGNGTGISGSPGPSSPATTPYKTLSDIVNSGSYASLYLGITVDDGTAAVDAEISPRQQMVSGAFALRAKVAESVVGSSITTTMLGDAQVITSKIAASAVDSSRIADQTIVSADIKDLTITATKLDSTTVGVWTPVGTSVYRNNNVGIGEANPGFPLNFASSTGDKISLWGNSGNHVGLGVQGGLLQIYGGNSGDDIGFGYGRSTAFTETMRIKGTGNVGIGTSSPAERLVVSGTAQATRLYSDGVVRARGGSYGTNGTNTGFTFDSNGDTDGGMFSGADGTLQFYTDGTEKVRLNPAGNLGIGTTDPTAKLTVGSNLAGSARSLTLSTHSGDLGQSAGNELYLATFGCYTGNHSSLGVSAYRNSAGSSWSSASMLLGMNVDNSPRIGSYLAFGPSGIGIGTPTPGVRLDVVGSNRITMVDNYYSGNSTTYNSSNVTHTSTDVGGGGGIELYSEDGTGYLSRDRKFETSVSIRADGWIVTAKGFAAYSDRRIKRDAQASSTAEDLAAIEKLKVTHYRMVDPEDGDTSWRKGFIAQEVAEVIPGAVTNSVNFVPDIFSLAEAQAYDASTKTLSVKLAKEHHLKTGQRVRLHLDGKRQDLTVSEVISAHDFSVSDCENTVEKVFVYGSEVSDFSTLDYDRIYTTSVGAIQELARKVEAGEAENGALKTRQTDLEARLKALENLVKSSR
jgi:hypothetical protein